MEILATESNMLLGIFFQDEEMKKMFSSYPELVCVDATYKLLELHFLVYIMLVEDGNGLSVSVPQTIGKTTDVYRVTVPSCFARLTPNYYQRVEYSSPYLSV